MHPRKSRPACRQQRRRGVMEKRMADDVLAEHPMRKAVERGKKGGRVRVVTLRVSDAEQLLLEHKAQSEGLSVGHFIRKCALGKGGPRSRRAPTIDVEAMAAAAAAVNGIAPDLKRLAFAAQPVDDYDKAEARRLLSELAALVVRMNGALERGSRS